MKKRISTFALAVLMLLCAIPTAATETTEPTATEPAQSYCGDAIVWSFSGGTLTITGSGRMYDFFEGAPWAEHSSEITTVVLSGGVTYVGAYAFSNYDSLVSVNFGDFLEEIGQGAFYSCDGLTSVTLPLSFICFGSESFMSCRNLKTFYCNGYCPHFLLNCLRDTYGTIYYPATRPWPLEDLMELEEAFHSRIEFLASDGTDPIPGRPGAPITLPPATEPPVTVPPATEPPTETPTEEVTTEPPTEEATEDATEETTTEPPTEDVTEPTATATEEPSTEAPTEAPTEATAVPVKELTRATNPLLPIILSCVAALLIPVILLFCSLRKQDKEA